MAVEIDFYVFAEESEIYGTRYGMEYSHGTSITSRLERIARQAQSVAEIGNVELIYHNEPGPLYTKVDSI